MSHEDQAGGINPDISVAGIPSPSDRGRPETVLIGPTWEGTVGWYLRVLAGPALESTKAMIHAELLRLAKWVDARQAQDKDDSEVSS